MRKDPLKNYNQIMKEASRSNDELLKLLDTEFDDEGNEIEDDDEDPDEDYEPSTIKISMPKIPTPHVEAAPESKQPKIVGSCFIILVSIVFLITFLYMFWMLLVHKELHLVPLSISLVSAAIVVIYGRIVR